MNIQVEDSSGNVFKDLGLLNAEARLAKAEIASQIYDLVEKKRLTQAKVAKLLDITQPKVSCLLKGNLRGFSLERLLRFLNILGQDVKISTSPSRSGIGHMTVKPSIAAMRR
ncbi:MAG: XRE family transcriptional regulator [Chlamydiae bacterium SM23_39]|nr:MAG: XRE family transcriptional regulator [Chlamydiae bacterium SM23_39]